MARHSFTVSPKSASESGALDGYEAVCICGDRQSTSLSEREAFRLGMGHALWADEHKPMLDPITGRPWVLCGEGVSAGRQHPDGYAYCDGCGAPVMLDGDDHWVYA